MITGAGSGLGRALALDICRRKGNVVVADIDLERAQETAEALKSRGTRAFAERCDVSSWEEVEALAAKAAEHLGDIDLVANNAGVAVSGHFDEISLEDWRWIVDINLWGVIYGCRAFSPKMRARGRGHILNVASAAGLLCAPEMSPYNVTKAAVVALSETLHAENKKHGVHVTALCPTFFKTNIIHSGRGPRDAKREGVASKLMERSKLQAPEVAQAALDAVERGDLYAVPMRDGRMMWRVKRLVPQHFYSALSYMNQYLPKLAR